MHSKISKWSFESKAFNKDRLQICKTCFRKRCSKHASKQIFARWQAILSVFDFDIEFIEGTQNSIPDFLNHEFLQNPNHNVGEKGIASPTAQTP